MPRNTDQLMNAFGAAKDVQNQITWLLDTYPVLRSIADAKPDETKHWPAMIENPALQDALALLAYFTTHRDAFIRAAALTLGGQS